MSHKPEHLQQVVAAWMRNTGLSAPAPESVAVSGVKMQLSAAQEHVAALAIEMGMIFVVLSIAEDGSLSLDQAHDAEEAVSLAVRAKESGAQTVQALNLASGAPLVI